MKNLLRLLLLSILLIPTFLGAQTSQELTNILAGAQASLNVVGQSGQSASGNNILLATAGTGAVDVTTLGTITYRSFAVQVIGSAAISAGQVTFEGSNDNTTFNPINVNDDGVGQGAVVVNGAITIAASTNRFFSGRIQYRYIRLRISTAFTGGTVQAITTYSPSDIPAPTGDFYVAGASAQTATVNNILTPTSGTAATDAAGFKSFAVQIVSTGTAGGLTFEGSNDNTNFQAIPVFNQALAVPVPIVTAITPSASQIIYVGATSFRYIRLRISTAVTGGSVQAFSVFRTTPIPMTQTVVAQGTAANMNVTASIAATQTLATVTTVSTVTTLSQFAASAAAADATANPTSTIVRAVDHLFNGTSWDRFYNNWNTTTGDAGAKTATFNGATQTNFNARGAIVTCLVGTVSGTSPTMTLQLQVSPDGGTTWYAVGAPTTALTATGTVALFFYPTNWSQAAGATPAGIGNVGYSQVSFYNLALPRTWRILYTIGGTTPSFTITSTSVQYLM